MSALNTHLDVYKLLPKTNCRDCGLTTCLAFAVAVMQGHKALGDCPHLPEQEGIEIAVPRRPEVADDIQKKVAELQEAICRIDLKAAAARLDLEMRQGMIVIPCLGKEFSLGPEGIISSCHVNPWLCLPLLNYVLHGAGLEPKGVWMPLRELPSGTDWERFFKHRCEKPLKKVIDNYTGLFELIIDVFNGQPAPEQFDSDIAVLIYPLPKLPVLICYWKPDDGLDSSLHMFFDVTAEKNLNIESIYILGVGLVTMFEKITMTHGQ